jgi:hypothetical protein
MSRDAIVYVLCTNVVLHDPDLARPRVGQYNNIVYNLLYQRRLEFCPDELYKKWQQERVRCNKQPGTCTERYHKIE